MSVLILPDDGTYDVPLTVTVQSAYPDVRFTTDGTEPTLQSAAIAPGCALRIEEDGTTVVTVTAFLGGRPVGAPARRTYTTTVPPPRLPSPVVSPSSGIFVAPVRVSLSLSPATTGPAPIDGTYSIWYCVEKADASAEAPVDAAGLLSDGLLYEGPFEIEAEGNVAIWAQAVPRGALELASATASPITGGFFFVTHNTEDANATRGPPPVGARAGARAASGFEADAGDGDAADDADGGGDGVLLTHTLPVRNVEFSNDEGDRAAALAQSAVAFLLAAAQVLREAGTREAALRARLERARREREELHRELAGTQRDADVAAAHVTALRGEARQRSVAGAALEAQAAALEERRAQLAHEAQSLAAQIAEVEQQLQRAVLDKRAAVDRDAAQRRQLEATFLAQRKQLAAAPPHLEVDAREIAAVLAEQRHEQWLLRETLASLRRAAAPDAPAAVALQLPIMSASSPLRSPHGAAAADADGGAAGDTGDDWAVAAPFLQPVAAIDVPTVETTIPLAPGALRRITTVQGNGLQLLRKRHLVQAHAVTLPAEPGSRTAEPRMAIRVYGHTRGVQNFVADVQRMLSS